MLFGTKKFLPPAAQYKIIAISKQRDLLEAACQEWQQSHYPSKILRDYDSGLGYQICATRHHDQVEELREFFNRYFWANDLNLQAETDYYLQEALEVNSNYSE